MWKCVVIAGLVGFGCGVDADEVAETDQAIDVYPPYPPLQETVKSIVDRVIGPVTDASGRHYRGLSVGVIKNGQRYIYHYGEAVKGTAIKPNSSTLYAIGSVTKTFTATLAALFEHRGMIDFDDKLDDYTSYPLAYPRNNITLWHLVQHRSGLTRDTPEGESAYQTGTYSGDFGALMNTLGVCPSGGCAWPVADTAEETYSNYGYAVLAYTLSRATSPTGPYQSVQGVLSSYLIDPLGMTSTNNKANLTDHANCVSANDPCTYSDYGECTYKAACNGTFSARAAIGYYNGHTDRDGDEGSDDNIKAGSGVLWSTPTDMMKWLAYNMDLADSGASSELRAILPAIHDGDPLGWGRETMAGGYDVLFKTGTLPSFMSHVMWIEGEGIGVFILANSDYDAKSKARELADELR